MEEPSTSSSANLHLTYPTASPAEAPSVAPSERPRVVLKDRLYVGNLHPTVDEYTLLQAFSKFGKVSKLDFLFHKAGPMRGKPRGYAFIEYANADDAEKALVGASDKLLRGRKLVITHAHQAPLDYAGQSGRARRGITEAGKPTTLSLLKSATAGRSDATEAKIAKMEAKLRQMEQSSSAVPAPSLHPSLPAKPAFSPYTPPPPATSTSSAQRQSLPSRYRPPLPSLPLQKPAKAAVPPIAPSAISSPRPDAPKKSSALAGVRIMKKKDKS
ncbi:hypothetical protein WOLCODRAFT_134643 [Wolfiporia cocos MD-104 SS10]|uniref:Probable RNA-binding protein 18 n=1 Tax=Wolfiporia cocos (strain MD-104) TaxID=742152 RepID=A0A2H3JMC1_WOLCO|nr:hypothetical protein WOLCODRAFT_134643 [Wolfiporia cocos MD-104 SS10]